MTANLTKEQARERKKEIIRTFTRMVEYARKNDVRVILIAGDLFDTRNVSALARNTVRDMISTNPDIDFLYLRGNHDSDNFLSKLEYVPENLLLFGSEWTSYRYGNVVISGLELSQSNQATAYNSLVLGHDDYNIVTLHGQVENYRSKEQAERISLNDLRNKNIDYLALGHVHSYVQEPLDNRGSYCYPGCLEGRGFDECGQKGFVLLDINEATHTAETTFVPIAARTLYTLEIDVTGLMTTQQAAAGIEQAIAKTDYPSGSMVKFVLTGDVEVDAEFNCDYLQDLFSDYYYFEKVYDRTHLKIDYSDYEKDASLKGEFIRMVLGSQLEEEQKAQVIRCGILALSGEEI
jgi:DNA repair exonuclease SbcCD nuclease subunit